MPVPGEITTSPWTCGSLPARSAVTYKQVCQQFDVEHAAEFQPQVNDKGEIVWTACNLLVWRCTKALGCELPHYWPKPMSREQREAFKKWLDDNHLGWGVIFDELNANRLVDWCYTHGPAHGWFRVDIGRASARADAGFPTVALLKVPQGTGHVAMVLPGDNGELRIAQAGAVCLWDAPITRGFGNYLPQVGFISHD